MLQVLSTVLPVFLLLACGYAGAKSGYLKSDTAEALSSFAVRLAVPALLFRAMYKLDLAQAFHPFLLIAFYTGVFSCFVLGIVLSRTVWGKRPGEAVSIGFTVMFSNTVLLGLPIMERAYGPLSLTPVYGIVALHAPSLYIVGMITMELSRRDGRPLMQTLATAGRSILTNSLMVGILAGLAVNLAGLILPEPIEAAVSMLAAAAIPAALVGIGSSLTRYSPRTEPAASLMVATLSLVVHPAIAFVLAYFLFALPPEYVRAAVIVAAMPPGMNGYVFALMYDRAVGLAATSLLISTVLSVFTISCWLAILGALL
ncbi:MAG: AEC family transporter [Rhizobiaceae bacterium]